MAWFKIDDGMAFHAKLVAAGNEAVGAWARMGAWSSHAGTDGFVPADVALAIAGRTEVIQRLETVVPPYTNPLLVAHQGGWRLHDFLEWNPSKEEVAERRAARSKAGKRGGKRSGRSRSKNEANTQASAQAKPKQNRTPIPIPIPIDPTDLWKPTPEVLAEARDKHGFASGRTEAEAAKFTHYHRSKGSKFVDWDAAFRNWLSNAKTYDERSGRVPAPEAKPESTGVYPKIAGQPNPNRWSKP